MKETSAYKLSLGAVCFASLGPIEVTEKTLLDAPEWTVTHVFGVVLLLLSVCLFSALFPLEGAASCPSIDVALAHRHGWFLAPGHHSALSHAARSPTTFTGKHGCPWHRTRLMQGSRDEQLSCSIFGLLCVTAYLAEMLPALLLLAPLGFFLR